MKQYLAGLKHVYDNGIARADRTGKGRHGVFSPPEERYRLADGFPLVTTREINPDSLIHELLFFISGAKTIENLKYGFFWKKWAVTGEQWHDFRDRYDTMPAENPGSIGHLYGAAWRYGSKIVSNTPALIPKRRAADLPSDLLRGLMKQMVDQDNNPIFSDYKAFVEWLDSDAAAFPKYDSMRKAMLSNALARYWLSYDQLNELVYNIKHKPNSSRLRVTAMLPQYTAFEDFSPQENSMAGRAALTPCHAFFQCYVHPAKEEGGKARLDLKLTMTSNDYPIGRVYNIAQYALLQSMLAHVTGLDTGDFFISTGDGHIYLDQLPLVPAQLAREPLPLPKLWLNPEVTSLFDFTPEDIRIEGYQFHPKIVYPVAV